MLQSLWVVRAAYTVWAVAMMVQATSDEQLESMRGRKCPVDEELDHATRSSLHQECVTTHYKEHLSESQCYPELGCFFNDKAWSNTFRPFPPPLPPAEINTDFYCYTRDSEKRFDVDVWPEISINDCPFNAARRTVFITHGFACNGNYPWLRNLKDLYLAKVDANVFLMDWGHGAELYNYPQVASNSRIVGAELARFIKWLMKHHGLNPSSVHLMGHSLGAHASAYAAKKVGNIKRITGDVDFYINGGAKQPGCKSPFRQMKLLGLAIIHPKSVKELFNHTVEDLKEILSCSHSRSYLYFIDALSENCSLWGQKIGHARRILDAGTKGLFEYYLMSLEDCTAETCLPVGLDTPLFKARGVFAVKTKKTPPYCSILDVKDKIALQKLSEDTLHTKHNKIKKEERTKLSRVAYTNALKH